MVSCTAVNIKDKLHLSGIKGNGQAVPEVGKREATMLHHVFQEGEAEQGHEAEEVREGLEDQGQHNHQVKGQNKLGKYILLL